MFDLETKLDRLITEIISGKYTTEQIEMMKEDFINRVASQIEDAYAEGYESAEKDLGHD